MDKKKDKGVDAEQWRLKLSFKHIWIVLGLIVGLISSSFFAGMSAQKEWSKVQDAKDAIVCEKAKGELEQNIIKKSKDYTALNADYKNLQKRFNKVSDRCKIMAKACNKNKDIIMFQQSVGE